MAGPALFKSREGSTNTHAFGMAQMAPGQSPGKANLGSLGMKLSQILKQSPPSRFQMGQDGNKVIAFNRPGVKRTPKRGQRDKAARLPLGMAFMKQKFGVARELRKLLWLTKACLFFPFKLSLKDKREQWDA